MKSELDALMRTRRLDAILVLGNATHNPPMYYLTGGGHVSAALIVKKLDQEAVLFCNDMEPAQAASFLAKLGLDAWPPATYSESGWRYDDLDGCKNQKQCNFHRLS